MQPNHPFSPEFNEHYWSGGAPEKTHVYLHGNHLPQRFPQATRFTVAELGFGTALNFLLTARLWQATAPATAQLTYISYELHPLTTTQLLPIHAVFPPELHPLSLNLLRDYHPHPGWNVLPFSPTIALHLYVGDAALGLPTQPQPADAWFLDGFSPANNPALWTPELLNLVAQHTNPHGTASTYSVASRVQKALTDAGFHTEQTPGFPPKGHMLTAIKS